MRGLTSRGSITFETDLRTRDVIQLLQRLMSQQAASSFPQGSFLFGGPTAKIRIGLMSSDTIGTQGSIMLDSDRFIIRSTSEVFRNVSRAEG